MRNATLQAAIGKVINSNTPSLFSLQVEFVSKSDSSYAFTPLQYDGIRNTQNSVTNYTDDIVLQFWISAADYANMYDHMQDLHAVVQMCYHDQGGTRLLTTAPLTLQFRASIVDPKDIRKEMVDAHLRTEVDRSVRVRLTAEDIYTARSVPINAIYRTCSVTDAIHNATLAFGISGVTMETADNIHVYDHILIPPMKKFADFYGWIQHDYGVYLRGMVHYYTNSHLYVFAPFNLTPTTPKTLVVYQAEKGSLGGATSTCTISDTAIEVATDTVHDVSDKTAYGSENVGTSMTFLRSSQLTDGVVQYDSVNGAKFRDDVSLTIGLTNPKTLTTGEDRPTYATTTDNVFALSSAMTERQATTMTVEWTTSVPFILRPGLAVTYYSDESGTLTKRQGILEVIDTALIRVSRSATGTSTTQDIFKASTKLSIRLQPEGVATDTIAT